MCTCVYVCVVGGIYGTAWHKARFLGLKFVGKGRECFCDAELLVPDESKRSSNCSTFCWFVPQTVPSRGLYLADEGLICKCCKEAL